MTEGQVLKIDQTVKRPWIKNEQVLLDDAKTRGIIMEDNIPYRPDRSLFSVLLCFMKLLLYLFNFDMIGYTLYQFTMNDN